MSDKKELKARKKAYKKARRKATRPWKFLTGLSAPLFVIFLALSVALGMFDNTVALFVGGSFWELENEDPSAQYFTGDFATEEERNAKGAQLVYQVEAEGAALLTNNDKALPLAKGAKVSLFSTSSVSFIYGGTGSANVDASKADNLKSAMEKAGFSVNQTLWDFYLTGEGSQYVRDGGGFASGAKVGEAPWTAYADDVLASVEEYGDAAVVTLSRVGGEGVDLTFKEYNYLALDENEKAMMAGIKALKDAGKVDKVIVLINSSNPLQVDFLKNNEYGVDATLWVGGVGAYGINAVADILAGAVNPSGSLVDTYTYDNYSSPAMQNFVPVQYDGDLTLIPDVADTYMIYQEGIYVGYKYYETRYEDFVMGTGNAGNWKYGDDVAFPFGYGLSYTTFEYSDMSVSYNKSKDQFTVSVKVTNTGDVAGKEVVQVYLNSPYTDYDRKNGVEKASAALVGFEKTDILKPGKSETVKVTVDRSEFASFDTYGKGTYILDAGDYYLTVATDSHNAVNNFLAAKGFTVENTKGKMDSDGNAELTYKYTNEKFDAKTYSKSANGTEITNKVSSADPNLYEGVEEDVVWLTRNDWTGTMPSAEKLVKIALTEILAEDLQLLQYKAEDYPAMEMPVMGADNGLKLVDMIGLDYNDPKWDLLLDQMTFDEMVKIIGDSFHWTMPVKSVEAPGTRDENGPQGLTVTLFGSHLGVQTTALTSEDVLAATFNKELVYQIGNIVGNDCLAANVAILYGPGANMHRTPYGGRNFEYYSEDGFLAGEICAAECKGIEEKGVRVVIKHFALNDCEQDRTGLGVWLNEQAAREIYLKAYQKAFEEVGANGVMMAYTRWGTMWAGAHSGLVNGILRGEWGSNGLSISDNVITTMVNGVDGIMAGNSTYDAMLWYVTQQLPEYENDAVVVNAMREACHHNLYAVAHSCGMNGMGPDTTIKLIRPIVLNVLYGAMVLFGVLLVVSAVMLTIKKNRFKKSDACREYKEFKAANK
ncbi:MAG: glycoside hydrolase family 3 C-terminal domain-containing protein [Oscillospiraceae bacterium]|nr:glycoside hydrolase family 3 C-terminal domain-containing protein [Oscillospiraceae bacterium]